MHITREIAGEKCEMSKKRLRRMIIIAAKEFKDPYYQGFAAQLGFFFLLSVVPMVIFITQLLGYFDLSLDIIKQLTGKYMQQSGALKLTEGIENMLNYTPPRTINLLMIGAALWAASRAQFSMARITNYIISSGKTTGGYWVERFRAVKTIVLTMITFVFALIIMVYGESLLHIALAAIRFRGGSAGDIADIWFILRWPIGLVLYFLMISYNYYVLPNQRIAYKKIIPGSVFAAIGMMIITLIYALFQRYVWDYNFIYGSFASIVALLFWFYFLAWILVLGVLCNRAFWDTEEKK